MLPDSGPFRVFLLSPAHCGGKRAGLLLNPGAQFPLAARLQSGAGVPIGEVFRFLSGLYFRGKLAYAERFARPPAGWAGMYVITANRGLLPADTPIGLADLQEFATVDIHADEPRYRQPLARDAARFSEYRASTPELEIVLLGSIATGKYTDVLLDVVGERLVFPSEFTGRGDMSRGALLLRATRSGEELAYEPVRRGSTNGRNKKSSDKDPGDDQRQPRANSSERRRPGATTESSRGRAHQSR